MIQMSHRPIEEKKRRRVAKAFRRTPLPAYFNLIRWMIDHGHARTPREARQIILDRRVKSDSHVIGVEKVPVLGLLGKIEEEDMVFEHVPVEARSSITVAAA
jgi:hypothetical protein